MAGQFVIPSSFSEEARLVISRIMWIEPRKRLDLGRVFKKFLAFFQAKKFRNSTARLGEKTFSNSREADSSEVEVETPKKQVKVSNRP